MVITEEIEVFLDKTYSWSRELEIDAKVKAGVVDFIMGEKKKEYYNFFFNDCLLHLFML